MAGNVAQLRQALLAQNKYSDVDDSSVSIGKKVTVWASGDEKRIKIYKVCQLDDTDSCKYGAYMISCLEREEHIDADLATVMLSLAVSMRDPENISSYLLAAPVRDDKYFATIKPKEIVEIGKPDVTEDATISRLQKVNDGVAANVEDKSDEAAGTKIPGPSQKPTWDLATQASAYSYIAGFLMRLQCRQVDNVHGNIKNAATRFKGWYDNGYEMIEEFGILRQSLDRLKDVLSRKPELVGTWVMWLANTENEVTTMNKQPRGLLEYIGLQIYAYQGLHVVTQILTIKQISKVPMSYILKELDCPITRDGVKEVYNIIKNYEVTDLHPTRKTYFRYARVWGDGYFLKVRSADCAPLLYTAARVVKEISSSNTSDPTQIYAVQKLGDSLKATLDHAAKNLIEALLTQTTTDGESGSMWERAPVATV